MDNHERVRTTADGPNCNHNCNHDLLAGLQRAVDAGELSAVVRAA
jgi:hypothetical protein